MTSVVTLPRGRSDVGATIDPVMDSLAVTDRVYFHLKWTEPLVAELVRRAVAVKGAGKLLLICPNETLARVLIKLGYDADIWQVPHAIFSPQLREQAVKSAALDELLAAPAPVGGYDLIVMPFVLEAAGEDPTAVLSTLANCLKQDGVLLVAVRLPRPGRKVLQPALASLSWPLLPATRTVTVPEIFSASRQAGLKVTRGNHVISRTATISSQPMALAEWLRAVAVHQAKRLFPGWRDCYVATLTGAATRIP